MKRMIYTDDPQRELWSLLGLFESKKFVSERLRKVFPSISNDKVEIRTDEITYSIRQAREYFFSSDQVSLLTRPLLLSYGMLNLSKALVYYKSREDTCFEKYFKVHGLNFVKSTTNNSLATECIEIKKSGVFVGLTSIFNQISYPDTRISLKNLLSQVPDLYDMYCYVYNERPNVKFLKSSKHCYSIGDANEYYEQYKEKIERIKEYLDENEIRVQTYQWDEYFNVDLYLNMKDSLKSIDLSLPSISGLDYFRFPLADSKLFILKEIAIHYLLIFSYGMLARYNAPKWGQHVDPNLSNEAELIRKSIQVSKIRYLQLLVNSLFDEEFQFSNSVEKEEINFDNLYRKIKDMLYKDMQRELL
mgnify:CR=1 FL=1